MKFSKPRARVDGLVSREVGDELLVYDLERHRAYCLNRMATQVFRRSDGETTIAEITRRIGDVDGVAVDERVVRFALARLERAHLLDTPIHDGIRRSRRDVLRTLGRAAAVGMPLVTALTVPTSAQAASCACGTIVTQQPCNGCVGVCGRRCSRTCAGAGKCQ
jgi:hypothetical protein